jgi:hypothetical protein
VTGLNRMRRPVVDADRADLEAAERELHDAISQVLSPHGLMVTKWILGVEGIGDDGERVLETFTSPDFRSWDSIGIIGFLDARERGAAAADSGDE